MVHGYRWWQQTGGMALVWGMYDAYSSNWGECVAEYFGEYLAHYRLFMGNIWRIIVYLRGMFGALSSRQCTAQQSRVRDDIHSL